jgi:hypothetical protein
LWNDGDPTKHQDFINAKKEAIKTEAHVPGGDTPFMPHELIALRSYLSSRNSLYEYMIYVILLWTIRTAMRASFVVGCPRTDDQPGIPGLTDESWEPRLWYVSTDGKTDGITFTYKDKAGKRVTISSWRDKTTREFSLPCHYLGFRYFLFPLSSFAASSFRVRKRWIDCLNPIVRTE